MNAKKVVAEYTAGLVEDGMTVGLGSGSTAALAIRALGARVRDGLSVVAVASSRKSEALAREEGILVATPSEVGEIDLAFDGADEVDPLGNLLKGGGGSLLREKIVAYASRKFYVMVDETKRVTMLGVRPLPVEITPFGITFTAAHLRRMGATPVFREAHGQPFTTDNGNYILDCQFSGIADPATLDMRIRMIPGVVETGLFLHQVVTAILVGSASGEVTTRTITP